MPSASNVSVLAERVGADNGRIARTAEAQLDADLAASKEKLRALELQAKDLSALKTDLIGRLREYQQASIVSIQQEIIIRQQRIATLPLQCARVPSESLADRRTCHMCAVQHPAQLGR